MTSCAEGGCGHFPVAFQSFYFLGTETRMMRMFLPGLDGIKLEELAFRFVDFEEGLSFGEVAVSGGSDVLVCLPCSRDS